MLFQKVYITSQNLQKAQTCSQKFAEAEKSWNYMDGTIIVPNRHLIGC